MIRYLLITALVAQVLSQGYKEFRFDYDFDSQAGGWLKFHAIPGTWREARLRCYAEGAVLASPLNEQMKTAMISFVAKHKASVATAIFTGIHASFSKGDYSSVEGVPLLRLPVTWGPGEPDNYENSESCIAMVTDIKGSMSDVRCTDVLPYMCYKKDTVLNMTECGTTDPAYVLEPRTGSCYKFHKRGMVWNQAYMTCVAEGGHLVVIDSEQELEIVKEYYAKYPDSTMFSASRHTLSIGFHDWGERVNFMTIHGEALENEFLIWPDGEPNNLTRARNYDEGEFCGSVYRQGQLNDLLCGIPVAFLCEKKPNSLLTF